MCFRRKSDKQGEGRVQGIMGTGRRGAPAPSSACRRDGEWSGGGSVEPEIEMVIHPTDRKRRKMIDGRGMYPGSGTWAMWRM